MQHEVEAEMQDGVEVVMEEKAEGGDARQSRGCKAAMLDEEEVAKNQQCKTKQCLVVKQLGVGRREREIERERG